MRLRVVDLEAPVVRREPAADVGRRRVELTQFADMYREQVRPLTALAFSLTGRWHVAEEVVHDVFASTLTHWARVRKLEHPHAWLRRAVANRCASHFRRAYIERRALARLDAASATTTATEQHEHAEIDVRIWELVRRLPRRQAQAVALRYVLDLDRKEVARTMRCSEEAVKTHLKRAMAALRTALQEQEQEQADDGV